MTTRLLAAEDSPTQAAFLRRCVEDAGFEVRLASNGAEALTLAEAEPFDLVVSDVVMPELGGYDLCRALKAMHPDRPVILLTGLDSPLDVIDALDAGADNFLRKPYEPADLVARIRSVLHNRDLRAAAGSTPGLELSFRGSRFTINSDRQQILDLLVATFEDLVSTNQQLRAHDEELAQAHEEIAKRLAEAEIERERLHGVLAAVPQAMAVVDPTGVIVDINENLARLLGQDAGSLRGGSIWDAIHLVDHSGRTLPVEHRALTECLVGGKPASRGEGFDVFLKGPDGGSRPVISRTAPVLDGSGNVIGAVGTLDDIGQLQLYDPVTGLPGHGILIDRLMSAMDDATRDGNRVGVLVVAIDRFEVLRSSLSPPESAGLIAGVADGLEDCLAADEVLQRSVGASVGYLGNAEFAVVLPAVSAESDVIFIGEFVSDRLSWTADIEGVEVPVTVSVAVGTSEGDDEPAALLSSAAASVRQRREGPSGAVITSDAALHATVIAQLQKESDLRRAIDNGEITVHYQPHVQLRSGAPVGVEALARWEHPTLGLLGAEDIIPLAMESGLILPLSWQVLEVACRQVARWRRELPGASSMSLSVNVTPAQLEDTTIAHRVARVLADTGLPPSALILEITEGSVMRGTRAIGERLGTIKALGAQIAIDDFGTGYSSLRQLRELPVDILKIDQSFVAGMCVESGDAAIVAGSIRLGRALGLEIVAEGVETTEQLVQLRVLGCEQAQGYYFAKALTPRNLEAWWPAQPIADAAEQSAALELDEKGDDGTLAYLIHELRTPLVALLGFTQLLSEAELSDEGRELLDVIMRSAEELDERVASVRDARDAVEGGMTLDLAACDVAEVVRTLAADLSAQLSPHPLRVECTGDATTLADRARVVQAVTNLLTNAAKFAPPDTPIEINVHGDDGDVTVSVRDYGPGIPEHRRPELFRRFSRLGSRTKGMGIGLYLARVAAVAHGGELSYAPASDRGSIFSLRLPKKSAVAAPRPVVGSADGRCVDSPVERPSYVEDVSPRQVGSDRDHRLILYVEDSPANVALVHHVADRLPDVILEVALDGATGVEMATAMLPDLVLLDLHLPDLEGDEVLKALRSDQRTADLPVIIASADVGGREEELAAAGATGVIHKPFDIPLLRALLQGRASAADPSEPELDEWTAPADPSDPLDRAMVSALEELAAMSSEPEFDDVIGTFEAAVTSSYELLERAVSDGRTSDIVKVAHELAGTSSNFGAHVVSETCRELERKARANELAEASPLVWAIGAQLDVALRALREVFPTMSRSTA